jgi:hypothetical protein
MKPIPVKFSEIKAISEGETKASNTKAQIRELIIASHPDNNAGFYEEHPLYLTHYKNVMNKYNELKRRS